MKEHALKFFRQPPERLNCAQAVLHAWREVSGDTTIALADLKHFGGGWAPGGSVEAEFCCAARLALLQGTARGQSASV